MVFPCCYGDCTPGKSFSVTEAPTFFSVDLTQCRPFFDAFNAHCDQLLQRTQSYPAIVKELCIIVAFFLYGNNNSNSDFDGRLLLIKKPPMTMTAAATASACGYRESDCREQPCSIYVICITP